LLIAASPALVVTCTPNSPSTKGTDYSSCGTPAAADATVPTPNSKYFGVNTHFVWQDTCFQDQSIDLMQKAGVQTVRFDLPWNLLEPKKGEYNQTMVARLDHAVDVMVTRHIEPIAVLAYSPAWASGSDNKTAPPRNNQDYNDFLSFWIKRYAGKVNAYEVWNEPNYFWYPKADPVRYTDLLKSAYTTAKKINPDITILAGSLTGSDGNTKTGPQWFLRTMYANGAKGYFDVLSQHGYSYPLNAQPPQWVFQKFKAQMLPIMQAAGDGARPIWWTEHGYSTGGPLPVVESAQASYLTQAYEQARVILPNMTRLYYYEWGNDRPTVDPEGKVLSTNTEDYFGMIDPFGKNGAWRPKAAYTAFKKLPKS